jgi:hypothetical protein
VSLSKLKEAQKGIANFTWNMLKLPDNWKEIKRIKIVNYGNPLVKHTLF